MKNIESQAPEKGHLILGKMSSKLKDEVYRDFYGQILHNTKLFKFNFSKACIDQLSNKMQEYLYGPGELIFSQNEVD